MFFRVHTVIVKFSLLAVSEFCVQKALQKLSFIVTPKRKIEPARETRTARARPMSTRQSDDDKDEKHESNS